MVGPHARQVVSSCSRIWRAIAFQRPMASRVAMQPSRTGMCSSSGMAVISLEWSSIAVRTGTSRLASAQAPARCRGSRPRPRSWELRTHLPSTGTTGPPVSSKAACIQSRKHSSKRAASSRVQTRPGVLCEGIPCGSSRKVRSYSSLSRPKRAMTMKLSMPQMTRHRQHQDVRQGVQLGAGDTEIFQDSHGLDVVATGQPVRSVLTI